MKHLTTYWSSISSKTKERKYGIPKQLLLCQAIDVSSSHISKAWNNNNMLYIPIEWSENKRVQSGQIRVYQWHIQQQRKKQLIDFKE